LFIMENVFRASWPQPQSPAATKSTSESLTFSALAGTKISKYAKNKKDVPAYNNQIGLPLIEIFLINTVTFTFFMRTLLTSFYIKRIVARFSIDLTYLIQFLPLLVNYCFHLEILNLSPRTR